MNALSLEHAILGLLNQHPRSGYDLKTRCFDGPLKPFWGADQAQIYRTLDRLERERLVSSRRKRQSGRPDRKLYEITHSGRESLGEWLVTPLPAPASRDPFLLQLQFGSSCSDEHLLGLFEARREEHQSRLDELRVRASELAADHSLSDRTATLGQTAFDGAIARERATVDWLDDCIEAIRAGALSGSEDPGIGQRHLFGT